MSDIIVFAAHVAKVETLADGTLQMKFAAQEMGQDKMSALFSMNRKIVMVAVKAEDFGAAELEALEREKADAAEFGLLTDSQMLRRVLFRRWQHEPDGFKDADSHYHARMQQLIKQIKAKLP